MRGCPWRKAKDTGMNKLSSTRRCHISTIAWPSAPTPNNGGSGWTASK
jgi:hypothetical protein